MVNSSQIDVKVYYVEMVAPPRETNLVDGAAPRDGLSVIHARHPTVAYYRFLYNSVGADYHWRSRQRLSDLELAALISDALLELHVLFVEGVPAGFAELDRRAVQGSEPGTQIEIVQFGLIRDFIGQGLGKYFLEWTIAKAWSYQPRRLWLHTCTLDHPAALPNYLKRGFTLFKEEWIQREISDASSGKAP